MCHLSIDGKMYQRDSAWSHGWSRGRSRGRYRFVGFAAEDGSRVHMTKEMSEWLLKLQRENDSTEAIEGMKRHRAILKEHGIEDLTGGLPFTITVPDGIDLVRIPSEG